MGVSKNQGTPKSSILIRFSIINHPFSGTPIFGNTQKGKFSGVAKVILPLKKYILQWFQMKVGDESGKGVEIFEQ